MAYKPKVLPVADSGTGVASFTAYTPICGGTTSTNPFQSVAALGSSGDILTSNGASNLPTFQTPSASGVGYTLTNTGGSGNPADGQTYFFGASQVFTTYTASGFATTRLYAPVSGTLSACYGAITVGGTLGSNENCTLVIRLNNTTDTTVTSTLQLTAASNGFSNTGLSIAITAGDFIEFKFTGAAWGTNPTTCRFTGTVYIA